MTLFLVQGDVEETPYLDKTVTSRGIIRLVEAENAQEASEKFEKHFRDQTVEYCTSYYATVTEVSEVIA